MANPNYGGLLPLGKITIAAAGSTQLLTVNCGSQSQASVATEGVKPTVTYRQIILTADANNASNKQIFLLPAGNTASGNPAKIIVSVPPGQSRAIPEGFPASTGIILDNYVIDTDGAGSVVYGVAIA